MRLVGIVVAIVILATGARADDAAQPKPPAADAPAKPKPNKAPPSTDAQLKPYAGRIVFSPDAPPTQRDDFPRYLKANAVADNSYDVLKGPPWQFHLVAVLAKDPGTKPIALVFADKDDKKLKTMHSVEVRAQQKIVTATSEATDAAGFAANKTYVVRLMQGKTVLAKAQLHLNY
jgi:hypothetical protein